MAISQLYMDALAKPCVTFADRCKSGRNTTPAYLPGTTGLKDVRLRPNQKLHIRAATRVSLSNGSCDEAAALLEYETSVKHAKKAKPVRNIHKPGRRINGRGMILDYATL